MNIIQPPHTKSPLPNTSNHYVNNKELYAAFVEYKRKYNHAVENNLTLPRIPNYIGECILKIATGLSTKFNFALYPYREEMISDGIENCFMYINNFDPDKYTNPFAYFTQIIMFAFIRRIQKEKKQLYIKHKITEQQIYSNLRAEIPSELVDDTFVNSYEDMLTEKRNKAKERIKKTNPPKKVVDTGYEDCV